MKRTGKHPDKALTPVRINAMKQAGRYADGNGLYLVVDPSGAKRWILRTIVQGRRRDIGLGSLRLVSLGEAREAARTHRKVARDGGNPLAERRRARAVIPTFEDLARTVHGQHKAGWKNAKHGEQWITTLKTYAFPALGNVPVDQIGTPEVLRALAPIWLPKPETARRVRQRIGTVLDYAKAAGYRSGGNPVEGIAKALPRQPDRRDHHAAMPYTEVSGFIRRLQAEEGKTGVALALEFLILTAARTGEVLGAKWTEIDLEQGTWTIPDNRMKAGREHRVPLSSRAIAVLRAAQALGKTSEFVFPGRTSTRPMSNMAFLMLMRRLNVDYTVHGFRSSFRDWASERTNFTREICEAALAHMVKDRTEAAYRRGDLFEKRRELMISWAAYVSSSEDKIVPIRRVS
ncbi:integrase [Afipia massiliensis]|uniref:Integrase n=1 Tax=Afipia massiliensis TaxID=211460 RepID=A0A840MUF2_9BRAD|nr:site-specific integrase [Afipia massiliensis]MBB5050054.1 integrase [Afipia massiliensis]